jgi:DNA polymerase sigma
MPYLKSNNAEATRIHEEYQSSNDQQSFLKAARLFLESQNDQPLMNPSTSNTTSITSTTPNTNTSNYPFINSTSVQNDSLSTTGEQHIISSQTSQSHFQRNNDDFIISRTEMLQDGSTTYIAESRLRELLLSDDDPIVSVPQQGHNNPGGGSIWAYSTVSSPITPPRPYSEIKATSSPWGEVNHTPQTPSNHDTTLISPIPKTQPTPDTAPPISSKKENSTAKRLWTHFTEQPGRILVNGIPGEDYSITIPYGPKEEVAAHYTIPMDYLKQYSKESIDNTDASLDKALTGLTIGLFRRGCTENGQQASIISKEIKGFDRWYEPSTNSINGKVPFFSPRTPGNVLFRMYWENDPTHTIAMGPTLHVRIVEQDFENSIRFILSNFKSRKSNPTSLSSLHSLATVLETPLSRRHDPMVSRSVWGCVQEARKVVDACYQEYIKTCSRLLQLDAKVDELKKQLEEEDTKSQDAHIAVSEPIGDFVESGKSETELALIEKTRNLLAGRASCERKWRDSQLAFASILEAVLKNKSMGSLLRRDLIAKMRIEYDLWCPLSEEFAVPNETTETWFECIEDLPQSITADHVHNFQQARIKMQMRNLGFDINARTLEDILFPVGNNSGSQRVMDPHAVNVFNSISSAMGQYYQELFADEEKVVRQRELIRLRTERYVQECGAFPPGTQVLVFGSSANGFGSPKSDLDMCLHLPNGGSLKGASESGAESMAKLAQTFEASGMKEVDSSRLTARIPIIMYKCPNPLSGNDAEEDLIECDLSMHNPLAVLNTSLLRSYAEITPVTRVLAAIIKRWAKARDINSPSRHTLSSYGYIIMLLHFLTYHKRTGNGLISPVADPEGDPNVRKKTTVQPTPILPNLQWLDPNWPKMPNGSPYRDSTSMPKTIMKHPMKDTFVNTHFYKPNSDHEKAMLQMLFAGQDLSLAILLATFFRYYAYEFDYKRHVVSLHSTASRGVVEREVKAEVDGWRNYSAALAIEDPFELDYDVAHVLRGGYYHRIRREFAMAYTKIADAASGRSNNSWNKGDLQSMSGKDLIDWICEPISIEREQG